MTPGDESERRVSRFSMESFSIKPIGVIRSEIKNREDAPLFYDAHFVIKTLERGRSGQFFDGLGRLSERPLDTQERTSTSRKTASQRPFGERDR